MANTYSLGWRPDLPDQRDHRFALMPGANRVLPPSARVDPAFDPPIGDQGQLGSCTAWMGCYLIEQLRRRNGLPAMDPSELFLYWYTRYLEGGVQQTKIDSGATIRDTVRALAKYGVPPEASWPYSVAKFRTKPPAKVLREAQQRQVLTYQRCLFLEDIKASIVDGYPVGIGFVVYESMMTAEVARTGVVPMPAANDQVLGGHAVTPVGYDDGTRQIKFRNQWGADWGDDGYGYLSYEYISNPQLAQDFWTIRSVELKAEVG